MNDYQTLPAPAPASASRQAQTNPPERLLVVEDDRDLRRLNAEVLRRAGYEVVAVADGADAWEVLTAGNYDLMITDNSMPKLSGVELLRKLRSARMGLSVIMATGKVPVHEFAKSPWLAPDATLLKPYTVGELLRLVKKVLREADPLVSDPPSGPANSRHRILVVDGDANLCHLSGEVLHQHGYQVSAAPDGAAGWAALSTSRYDLLITEHDLPKLTGIELVRKLRAAHMDLPVVMATERLPAYQLARNPSLNFAAMLQKPFPVAALLDTVNGVLRAHATAHQPMTPRYVFD